MTKKSRQKSKYYENEKSFCDEIKSVFHHFKRVFIEANKKNFVSKVRVLLSYHFYHFRFTCKHGAAVISSPHQVQMINVEAVAQSPRHVHIDRSGLVIWTNNRRRETECRKGLLLKGSTRMIAIFWVLVEI